MLDNRPGHWPLYMELIHKRDLPCAHCGSRKERELHRLHAGGPYIERNVQVLCFICHRIGQHNQSKFRVGDRVSLNGRTPAYVPLARHRPRTIKAVEYNPVKECNFYLLGANGKGVSQGELPCDGYTSYLFRSYQLIPWHLKGKPGRPQNHRRYRRANGKSLAGVETPKEFKALDFQS